jgi:phosphohistidine phosphatase
VSRQLLVLIRHAKSADGPTDIDRPLASRGRRDAGAIGRLLVQEGIVPDRVVVSPARRARQTWDRAQAELRDVIEVAVDERIYDNHVAGLLEVIAGTPVSVQTLAMVGHNPSFAELADALDDREGDRDARHQMLAGYPTAGVAIFELSDPWAEVHPRSATLRIFAVPRGSS